MATRTKGRIEPLDVSGTDFALLGQQRPQLLQTALDQTLVYSDDASFVVLLDHLSNHHLRPGQKLGTTTFSRVLGFAEGVLPGFDIAAKTIGNQKDRSHYRTTFDLACQFVQHRLVSGACEDSSQP